MPSLSNKYNWGSAAVNENPNLIRQIDYIYERIANIVNTKSSKYVAEIDPPNPATSSQVNATLDIGDFWVNKSSDTAWIMTSRTTPLLVTWTQIT